MTSIQSVPCSILRVSSGEAEQAVREQLQRGRELRNRPIHSEGELIRARSEQARWSADNSRLLARLFIEAHFRQAYDRSLDAPLSPEPVFGAPALDEKIRRFLQTMDRRLTELDRIRVRMDLCHSPGSFPA